MIRFLLLFPFFMQYSFSQLKQCYDPQGKVQPDLPCDPSANVSACCGLGYTCSTNFYCTNSKFAFDVIGTCTDDTWHDPACPLPLSQLILLSLHYVNSTL